MRQPNEFRRDIKRFRHVDRASRFERDHADNRDADGGQRHARTRPIAEVRDVRDRAHRAVITALRDRAEKHGKHERPKRGGVLDGSDVDRHSCEKAASEERRSVARARRRRDYRR